MKTNQNHTPGPWHVLTESHTGNDCKPRRVIYGPKWSATAMGHQACPTVATFLQAASEADERLIAAAPDLLAHLQTLVDGIAAGVAIPADGAAVAAARAVINRATGE